MQKCYNRLWITHENTIYCYISNWILFDSILQNHFRLAGLLVRGDDQQPEQERGAGDGVEHGGSAHLHRLRGRRRHRGQRGRQQDLGQGDQECHAGRCVDLTLKRSNQNLSLCFGYLNYYCSLYVLNSIVIYFVFFLSYFDLFFSTGCSLKKFLPVSITFPVLFFSEITFLVFLETFSFSRLIFNLYLSCIFLL